MVVPRGGSEKGLQLTAGSCGSTIQGLVINRFSFGGILISSGANTISGNYIGLGTNGSTAQGNGNHGITINGGANNPIGGETAADRNVISSNASHGIRINGGGATGNIVQGNYIGLDASGTLDRGNVLDGIRINGSATSNLIGGTVAGAGNVISGNDAGVAGTGQGNGRFKNVTIVRLNPCHQNSAHKTSPSKTDLKGLFT